MLRISSLLVLAAACVLAGAAGNPALGASGDTAPQADLAHMVMPKASSAQSQGVFGALDGAYDLAITQIGGHHYALVASPLSNGIQIINVTNPAAPMAVAAIRDGMDGFEALDGVRGIEVVHMHGMVYALAAGMADDGVQIIDITNPAAPVAISAMYDDMDGFDVLNGVHDVEIIHVNGTVYALAAAPTDDGVQIIDITNPAVPVPVTSIRDGVDGFDALDGVRDAHAASSGLVLASGATDDAVQIINMTDPASPLTISAMYDGVDGFDALDGVRDTATVWISDRHYALASGALDDGIQIIDITNPAIPVAISAMYDGVDGFEALDGTHDVEIMRVQGMVYALVASVVDDGVQIINITDPTAPAAISAMHDGVDGFDALDGARNMEIMHIQGMVYALVASSVDDGVQIINITNPAAPSAVHGVGVTRTDASHDAPDQTPRTGADHTSEEKSYMLDLINAERRYAGLDPVTLGNNPAAQIHADNMLEECFSGHWGVDGLLPYMRYSLAGGYQSNAENISGLDYCVKAADNYQGTIIKQDLRQAMDGLMNSPGHRANILDPHHAKVNIGLAWDDYNVMLVQHFEYGYVSFDRLPSIHSGTLSFRGTTLNGAALADDLGIRISYDPPPRDLTRGQVARSYCYGSGETVALLVPPLPPGYQYTTYSYRETTQPCPDPYDVAAGAPAPASVEQAHSTWREAYNLAASLPYVTRTVPYHIADDWDVSGNSFVVSADIESLLNEYGAGVYTVWIWGVAGGDQTTIASYSIFHNVGQPAGYG